MPHTTHVNRREEAAEEEGQDKSQRGFNKPRLGLGGKQEDRRQVSFFPKTEMETGQRGVLSSHRAVHLDIRLSISKINYFSPLSFYFLS